MTLKALIKGFTGELQSSLSQLLFLDSKEYHVFNNIIIQSKNGTTQIDHIIVSKYGVFVIETKKRDGWIFGDQKNTKWTEKLYLNNYQFQNPLHQNHKHVKSLEEFLKINFSNFHSVVIFWGNCEFKTQMPENVLNNHYTDYIKSKKQVLLSDEEVNSITNELQKVKKDTPFFGGLQHTHSLKKRYESTTTCPKCGAKLIEKIARYGVNAGQKFLGCEKYPQCHYTKEI